MLIPVADEDDQRQAVPELVRAGRCLGSIGAGHFVQHPMRGSAQALLVLLTANHRVSLNSPEDRTLHDVRSRKYNC